MFIKENRKPKKEKSDICVKKKKKLNLKNSGFKLASQMATKPMLEFIPPVRGGRNPLVKVNNFTIFKAHSLQLTRN